MVTLEAIKQFFKSLGLDLILLIGGGLGALVSLTKDHQLTFSQKFLTLVSGAVVANYLTPLFGSWLKAGENTKYGIAFLLGYLGLKSVELSIDYMKRKFGKS